MIREKRNYDAELWYIMDALADSVLDASDEEIREELRAEDGDPRDLADRTKSTLLSAVNAHRRREIKIQFHARIEQTIRDMHDGINECDDQHGDLKNMIALFFEINRTAAEITRYPALDPEELRSKICGDCLQMLSLHRRMLDRLEKPCSETQLARGLRKTIDRCIEELRWPLGHRRKIRSFGHSLSWAAFLCRHFAGFVGRRKQDRQGS